MASVLLLVFLFALGLAVVFGAFNKLLNYYRFCKKVNKIPGPPTHWLWGNLHQIELTEAYFTWIAQWRRDNNTNIDKLWLGPFDVGIELCHPRQVKKLLNEPKAENVYAMLEPWLGPGLLIANGKRWARSRRLLTPAFHFDILKPYVYVYNECAHELLSKWQHSADAGLPVNMCDSIRRITLDVLLQCACSYKSGCQKDDCDDPYVMAVERLIPLSADRFISPLVRASEFLYMYCTPQGWKYRAALKEVHSQSAKVIEERKKALKEMDSMYRRRRTSEILKLAKSSKKYLDFLDVLLAAQDDDGCGMTDLDVRHEVDTFMFEGHDTTGNAIIFTLYLLALYPEHQDKCREEIRDVLRGRDTFDYEDLSKLQYTTWCIKESLRRFSPVFNVYRRITEDVEIDSYIVPKGSWVSIDLYAIHMNPEVWENPYEFDPLRFHPDNVKKRHPFAYVPFSAGPRNCIGQNFAQDEERVVIGLILNRFRLELVTDEPVGYVPKVVLRPSKDIQLNLTPIH